MLVDELFALQPAAPAACGRPPLLACFRGRWMWRLHETPAGGFLSADDKGGKRGDARKLQRVAAAPRRLLASDAAQTFAAHTIERVVRMRLLFGGDDLGCGGTAGSEMEAAALAPSAPGDAPYDFWCNMSYDQEHYCRVETLQRSWLRAAGGAAPAADCDEDLPLASDADDDDELPPGFVKPAQGQKITVMGACAH